MLVADEHTAFTTAATTDGLFNVSPVVMLITVMFVIAHAAGRFDWLYWPR